MKTNREGLTFEEWIRATMCDIELHLNTIVFLESEWEQGVDPTEYASPQNKLSVLDSRLSQARLKL